MLSRNALGRYENICRQSLSPGTGASHCAKPAERLYSHTVLELSDEAVPRIASEQNDKLDKRRGLEALEESLQESLF